MSDPEQGNVPTFKRRRSRRHRRNRLARRWVAAGLIAVCICLTSALALKYLSPSLFQAQQSSPTSFQQSEWSRRRQLTVMS